MKNTGNAFRLVGFWLLLVALLNAMPSMAQATLSEIIVELTCSNITVSVVSHRDIETGVEVLVGPDLPNVVLLVQPREEFVVPPRGSNMQTLAFESQDPHTYLDYSIRIYNATTGLFLERQERRLDCSGMEDDQSNAVLEDSTSGAPFIVTCTADGGIYVQPLPTGTPITVTPLQLAQGFVNAVNSGQNVLIVSTGSISVWALTSQEVLVAYRAGQNEYDTVLPLAACGGINAQSLSQVTPSPVVTGQPDVPGGSLPGGGIDTGSGCQRPPGATATHIVRPGENLFRIGLRYGVSYTTLAAYNGIADPAQIYVGQCIVIP